MWQTSTRYERFPLFATVPVSMRHQMRRMSMRGPSCKRLFQVQVMLTEMLNVSSAQEDTMVPNNRRLGCHMALLSALLKANVMGPLTVRRPLFCHSLSSHGNDARELHLPLLVQLTRRQSSNNMFLKVVYCGLAFKKGSKKPLCLAHYPNLDNEPSTGFQAVLERVQLHTIANALTSWHLL